MKILAFMGLWMLLPLGITPFHKTESTTTLHKEKEIKWMSLEEAYAKNKKEPRKIMIDVYTDWCGWCKRMEKTTFSDEKVIDYVNEHFYAVHLNAESKDTVTLGDESMSKIDIARQFKVSGYPTIVFLKSDFKSYQPVPGYRDADGFMDLLKKAKDW